MFVTSRLPRPPLTLILSIVLVAPFTFVFSADTPTSNKGSSGRTEKSAVPLLQSGKTREISIVPAKGVVQRQAFVFIENRGQFDRRVRFLAKSGAANLWLTNDGIVFDFQRSVTTEASRIAAKEAGTVGPS